LYAVGLALVRIRKSIQLVKFKIQNGLSFWYPGCAEKEAVKKIYRVWLNPSSYKNLFFSE